jgi:uncharacterized linocin/CFP29 family protein
MDGLNAQVGWTEAQWNRVREEVLHAWQRVRVAGSFLPVYGSLPSSTQIVPSEIFKDDGTIDYQATAGLLEISLPVTLTRQQVREEDLSSALLQFRRRAMQVGQLEDWYVFNGAYPWDEAPTGSKEGVDYRPSSGFLVAVVSRGWSFLSGGPKPIADHEMQKEGLLRRNPGLLGLIEGAKVVEDGDMVWPPLPQQREKPDNVGLLRTVVDAINSLEEHGYVAPYVCVFGRHPFEGAHQPIGESIAFPRDRLEPLIGRELLHASAIDVIPEGYTPPPDNDWRDRGVLLSLTGDAVDLAIAAEATPEFRHVDVEGNYIFSVFERFTLRIKDPKAIVPLKFQRPEPSPTKVGLRRLLARDR